MDKQFLTIIVPVYNVEKYLSQCLESLVFQTVENHKVIVVDDGSKDSSGQIADKFEKNYPELFKVVHQKNKGLGTARNTGLSYVDTPFVSFLDSDDWLMLNFVESFCELLSEHNEAPDIIFSLPIIFDQAKGGMRDWNDRQLFLEIFKNKKTVTNAYKDPRLYDLEVSSCRRIFKMEFLRKNGFAFPDGTFWEDVQPHFMLVNKAQRCAAIAETGFFYRVNTNSQITSGNGNSRLQIVSVFASTLAYAIGNGWSKEETAHIIKTLLNFSHWSLDFTSPEIRKKLVASLRNLFNAVPKDYFNEYFRQYNVGRKEKVFIFAIRKKMLSAILGDYMLTRWLKGKFKKIKRGGR